MLRMYFIYCLISLILSVCIAIFVWDFVIVNDVYIIVPGIIVSPDPPMTT